MSDLTSDQPWGAHDESPGSSGLSRRQFLTYGGSAGLGLMILAACGRGTVTAPPSPGATPTPGTTPVNGAVKQTLTVFLHRGPTTADPGTASGANAGIMEHVYNSISRINWDTFSMEPDIAESVTVDADGHYLVKLREGVLFHNGAEATAESAKFSFDRYMDPDNASYVGSIYNQYVEAVEVVDTYTLRVRMKNIPSPEFFDELHWWRVLDPEFTQQHDLAYLTVNATGTGPWKLLSLIPEQVAELEANPDHFDRPPEIPRLTIRYVTDASARLQGVQRGEADIVMQLDPDGKEAAEAAGYDVAVVQQYGVGMTPLYNLDEMNPVDPDQPNPLRDVRVRQAMNYAVDVETLVDALWFGLAEPMRSLSPVPTMRAYVDPSELTDYSFNPDRARQLLADAGYPNGFRHRITVAEGLYPKGTEIVLAIAGMLGDFGIRTEVNPVTISSWIEDLYAFKLGPSYLDLGYGTHAINPRYMPVRILGRLKTIEDDEIQAAYDATLVTDFDQQTARLKELNKLIWEKAIGIFLWHPVSLVATAPGLNWTPRADTDVTSASWSA